MAEIVTMPKLGFDMAEGTLLRWVVTEGEEVRKGAILAEIETDKATVEVESAFEGVLARHLVTEGESVPVNTPIAVIAASGEKVDISALEVAKGQPEGSQSESPDQGAVYVAPTPTATQTTAPSAEEDVKLPGDVKASPLARRIADEFDISLKSVRGTGPAGRITKKDVEEYVDSSKDSISAAFPAVTPLAVQPTPASEQVPLNKLRSLIGKRMTEAKQRIPHFYVTLEYDVAELLELRQQVNEALPDGEKTSVNDFIIRAAALTLREFPNLNASLDEANKQVIRHGQVNIGVAVAVDGGLLTVVCHSADRKTVRQISAEVRPMVQRARDGKVRPDDIEGSTFSVSNMGMYDVDHFIAIINPPEAAILAVGSAREVVVVKEGQIVPGTRMKATLSVDHRVSDGAEAARFMQALRKYLEEPINLLI